MKSTRFFKSLKPPVASYPLLRSYTLRSWLKIDRSNVFIIPFAVAVLLVYATFTNGLDLSGVLSSVLVGTPVGYLIALLESHAQELQRVCNRRPFSSFLLAKTVRLSALFSLLFTFLIPVFVLIDTQFNYSIFDIGLGDFLKQKFFELLIISLVMAGLVNFFLEINRKLGPGVLLNLMTGKYHTPQSQERIFLFLDMKNSTTLAEDMGDLKFSQFLQDFFYDISDTISQHGGQVYQYVGDEVVISWQSQTGQPDNRAIQCFLAIQDRIVYIADYYRDTYGHLPQFKAGIHRGPVVIAEVGKVKSEIAYHGDVLNTTSRIVDLCRTLAHDLLISANVSETLNPEPELHIQPMGSFYLKGKSRGVTLYAVDRLADLASFSDETSSAGPEATETLQLLDSTGNAPMDGRTRASLQSA